MLFYSSLQLFHKMSSNMYGQSKIESDVISSICQKRLYHFKSLPVVALFTLSVVLRKKNLTVKIWDDRLTDVVLEKRWCYLYDILTLQNNGKILLWRYETTGWLRLLREMMRRMSAAVFRHIWKIKISFVISLLLQINVRSGCRPRSSS
jgi:hypothetical protein